MIRKLKNKLSGQSDLDQKVAKSVALSTGVFAAQILARIISTVVLTRLLSPEIFGVFAVVMTFIFILEQFSDIGVRSLILTKEDEVSDSFLRSCWTAQILRGIAIFAVCGLLALGVYWGQNTAFFPVGSSYADPALPLAVAAIGGFSIMNGFASPAKFLYERDMKFERVSVETLIKLVLTIPITITLAYWLRDIWALVWANLIGTALGVFFSFALFKGPAMRLNWNWADFKVIIDRGKWIVSHSALSALVSVADRVVLGFALSASNFGFYYIARQIVDLVELFLNTVHAQMGLQVFTALQEGGEAPALRKNYYRYRVLFDGLAMFAAGAFLTFAPALVEIIYDDRYRDVAGIIQLLAIGLILIGPGLLREAYSAQRRFREMTTLSVIRAVSIWGGLLIAVLVFDSMTAALLVIALHRIPETLTLLWKGKKEGWVSIWSEIRLLPLVALGAGFGWMLSYVWATLGPL